MCATPRFRSCLLLQFIEVYVTKVAPAKTPGVVGKLLDLDADEDFVKGLLNTVGACIVGNLLLLLLPLNNVSK